jgi:hypothetical protein
MLFDNPFITFYQTNPEKTSKKEQKVTDSPSLAYVWPGELPFHSFLNMRMDKGGMAKDKEEDFP